MDKKFTLRNKVARTLIFKRSRKKQLIDAIARHDVRLVGALLHDGVDVNFTFEYKKLSKIYDFNPLLYSIYECGVNNRDTEIVKLLLSRDDIQVNNVTTGLESPLYSAIFYNNIEIVKLLLAKDGIDLYITSRKQVNMPAFQCMYEDKIEILKLLIDKEGFDINKPNAGDNTLLMLAAMDNDIPIRIIKLLLEKDNIDINLKNKIGHSALTSALYRLYREQYGNIGDRVKLLISDPRFDVNKKYPEGNTPLIYTIKLYIDRTRGAYYSEVKRYTELTIKLIKLLLEKNIDVFIKADDGKDAFSLLGGDHDKEIKALIESKIEYELNRPDGDKTTAMIYYIEKNNIEKVRLILEKEGFDVNKQDIDGTTPLISAAYKNNIEIVKLLLEKDGIDLNKQNNTYHNTALILAIYKDNTEVVKLLLGKDGIDLNKQNSNGDTALIIAIFKHNTEIINLLLQKDGININIQSKLMQTALTQAIIQELHLVVKKLLDVGADPTVIDYKSKTLLIRAAACKQPAADFILKLLLATKKININNKDNKGKTALDYYGGSNEEIIDALTGLTERWQGFSKADIKLMDSIFITHQVDGKIPAANISLCPICLSYTERTDGCMYMTHTCSSQNKYYDRELHEKYKLPNGSTHWCTCCGRIAHAHTHYNLALSNGPKPSLGVSGSYYGNDCIDKGGGGIVEKLSRLTEYRNVALSLNYQIGKISYRDAYKTLIRAVWDAPLNIGVPRNLKKPDHWNEQTNQFPNRVEQIVNAEAPDIAPPPYLIMPKIEMGKDDFDDDAMMVKFNHKQQDGTNAEHQYNLNDFILFLTTTSTTADGYGYCIFYNRGCNSCLHPQEVLHISNSDPSLTKEMYERYKKFFNEKFKDKSPCPVVQGGGANEEDVIKHADDAMCLLPPKTGGKPKMKTRSKSRKIKNTRKKRY